MGTGVAPEVAVLLVMSGSKVSEEAVTVKRGRDREGDARFRVSPPPGVPGAVKVEVQEMVLPLAKDAAGTVASS
ncbi:MAG: hypothetical protein KatS3mg077_2347 [Candidatus Binatia bacterium]|nr:MAG: hypothetical protein KatS3mg077_2347 [Candidatus Binatia bacterium]